MEKKLKKYSPYSDIKNARQELLDIQDSLVRLEFYARINNSIADNIVDLRERVNVLERKIAKLSVK